jgi:hypothetical protein
MRRRGHIRLLSIATLVWAGFWVGGLPSYYRQYSAAFMVGFDLVALVAITGVLYLVLRRVRPERRLQMATWFAFYFTVPLALYDWLYCGIHLGHGWQFVVRYWYLSVYYVIPWIMFPAVARSLGRRPARR